MFLHLVILFIFIFCLFALYADSFDLGLQQETRIAGKADILWNYLAIC